MLSKLFKKRLIFLLFIISVLAACNSKSNKYDEEKITKEILEMANKWNEAWNGTINLDTMMALHHNKLQYYWHGKPMTYEGFKEVLEKYIIGVETYDNALRNPVVTIIDKNNAIIGFQLVPKNNPLEETETAFSLVFTRVNSKWKIIHIHEG